jgi:hypothetical protein
MLRFTPTVYIGWPATLSSGAGLREPDRTVATLFTACENAPSTLCYCFTSILLESHYSNLVIPGIFYLSYTKMLEDPTHERFKYFCV